MGIIVVGAVDQSGVVQHRIGHGCFLTGSPQGALRCGTHGFQGFADGGCVCHILTGHGNTKGVGQQHFPVGNDLLRHVFQVHGKCK